MAATNSRGTPNRPAVPDPKLVGEAARFLENGAGGADYIAWALSKEIIRLAEIASKSKP